MIAVNPSQGSCSVNNGNLICSLGSLPSGSSIDLSVVLNAAQTGFATNFAFIRSDTPESWTTNNRASQICFVAPPYLYTTNVTITEGNQGTANAVFEVRLSAQAPAPVSIHYSTLGFTAVENSDFLPVSGDLTFAPGVTNLSVPVQVVGDRVMRDSKTSFSC